MADIKEEWKLPCNYDYKIIDFEEKEDNNFRIQFRIRNIQKEEDVKKWLSDFEEKSKTTWRVARSYKPKGMTNTYRRDLRCHHNTNARGRKNAKISKNTDCPATLKIVINRYFDAPELKAVSEEIKSFPCIVDLRCWHNHSTTSASALRFRKMSSETRSKLLEYFEEGHGASSARQALENELLLEDLDSYHIKAADSSILPSVSVIQHLFNSSFLKPLNSTRTNNCSSKRSKKLKKNHSYLSPDVTLTTTDLEQSMASDNDGEKEIMKKKFDQWWNSFRNRILEGLEHNEESFCPAIKKCISNYDVYAKTETGLLSSLYNFGKYGGPSSKNMLSKPKGKQIPVQPTAVGRKQLLIGKHKLSTRRPALLHSPDVN